MPGKNTWLIGARLLNNEHTKVRIPASFQPLTYLWYGIIGRKTECPDIRASEIFISASSGKK